MQHRGHVLVLFVQLEPGALLHHQGLLREADFHLGHEVPGGGGHCTSNTIGVLPGVEPGPLTYRASVLPLHYRTTIPPLWWVWCWSLVTEQISGFLAPTLSDRFHLSQTGHNCLLLSGTTSTWPLAKVYEEHHHCRKSANVKGRSDTEIM